MSNNKGLGLKRYYPGMDRTIPNAYMRCWKAKKTVELRNKILLAYGNKCACCGEHRSAFLTLDHVGGGGRQHRLRCGTIAIFNQVIRGGFSGKYRILCMNCNFATRNSKPCPHEEEHA